MKLVRVIFLGLAVLLPTTWTMAKAGDEAPAAETKKAKKTKKSKKTEGSGDSKTEKKAE